MADGAISPLRIQKSTPNASPAKPNSSSTGRALAEISPMEMRRNSPSYNQVTKQMLGGVRESSPFDSSPYGGASPRAFWNRGASPARFSSENFLERSDSSASMSKRPSIEKLKQASRVKNSSMFAREQKNEYDPTWVPVVERPLAGNRPLSHYSGNAFPVQRAEGQQTQEINNNPFKGHRRGESQNKIPLLNSTSSNTPSKPTEQSPPSSSPNRRQASPGKSSLSSRPTHNTFPRAFDPNSGIWSEDDDTQIKISPPRALRRHAKSVTFDTAPPEVNEYEMVTPDPSSVASGSREGSYDDYDDESEIDLGGGPNENDDSFDASLEDTDKTPVVLPEDWRHMSPEVAHTSFASVFDDPFDGHKEGTPSEQWNAYRTASVNSDGDLRPLPPLPPYSQDDSRPGSASILDRVQAAHSRTLPNPPREAAVSKSDILGIGKDSPMSLEDRLRLMGLQDSSTAQSSGDKEAARLRKHGLGIHVYEEEVTEEEEVVTEVVDFALPRISRESILRKVHSRTFEQGIKSERELSPFLEERSYGDLDPDVPIPSREASSNFDEHVPDVQIKEEEDDDPIDLYSIPEMYAASNDDDFYRDGSVIRHDISGGADDESCYSPEAATTDAQHDLTSPPEDEGPPTPRQESVIRTSTPRLSNDLDGALPELSLLDDADFQSGLGSYLSSSSTPPPPPEKDTPEYMPKATPKLGLESVHQFFQREASEEQTMDEPNTPDSVVHRPFDEEPEPEPKVESPIVPEPVATIKAPGSRLKTRNSATPADLASMAATRRKVSGAEPPPIPEKSPKRLSFGPESVDDLSRVPEDVVQDASKSPTKRRQSFRGLDLSIDESFGEDISFGLDKEFERVLESSKKGYLMRQNTKVVIAKRNFSNESGATPLSPTLEQRASSAISGTRSAGSSPRKPSHERSKSWTTEPWNGKARRKSIRSLSGGKHAPSSGPAPPLPGQESAVSAGLDTVMEDQIVDETGDVEDGAERGRLFVKVVGVKELDLPMPQNERSYFQLTLDNGLHCVTTSLLELGRTAPIGQEFELVVLNDLEFQLTLQTKLTPPAKVAAPAAPVSPSKPTPRSPTKNTFGNLFMSPKKRREAERVAKEKLELEAQRAAIERQEAASRASRNRPAANATAWDLLHDLVGSDGSFGRTYVCLKNHEEQCFGRPIIVDMPIFNEWALEDASITSSVKSKRGGQVRRPPYQVGKLTLQLLYVPRPKSVTEEDMPKSMSACVRELREAEEAEKREYEGFLSQQGGDCPFWRRRFFRLVGTKLTAYHESTRQPRAKIDLAKAAKIIDDKSSLVQNPAGGKSGKGRRKSAFAEEDEGYQFVEEGFRIRFANGETIDFYADRAADKQGWMEVLVAAVGKSAVGTGREWCKVVLAREKKNQVIRTKAVEEVSARPQSSEGLSGHAQNMREKAGRLRNNAGAHAHAGAPSTPSRREHGVPNTPQTAPQQGRLSERRKAVRSMMF